MEAVVLVVLVAWAEYLVQRKVTDSLGNQVSLENQGTAETLGTRESLGT